MTKQPRPDYKLTDQDGDSLTIEWASDGFDAMVTVRTKDSTSTRSVWVSAEDAPLFARAILDAAGARPATDPEPEPKVEKRGGCYYVDGVHTACSVLADTVEEAERRLSLAKFLQAGREQAQADLKAHRDRVARDIFGLNYNTLLPNPRTAVDRIVELESAK